MSQMLLCDSSVSVSVWSESTAVKQATFPWLLTVNQEHLGQELLFSFPKLTQVSQVNRYVIQIILVRESEVFPDK